MINTRKMNAMCIRSGMPNERTQGTHGTHVNAPIGRTKTRFKKLVSEVPQHYYKPLHEKDLSIISRFKHLAAFHLNLPTTYLYLINDGNKAQCMYWTVSTQHAPPSVAKSTQAPITEPYIGHHRFDEQMYNETLLEGEVIDDAVFLISDIHVYQNKPVMQSTSYKAGLIRSIIEKRYTPDKLIDTYRLMYKEFVDCEYIKSFWDDYRQLLPYSKSIVGVVFRPNMFKANKDSANKSIKNFSVYLTKPHCYDISKAFERANAVSASKVTGPSGSEGSMPAGMSVPHQTSDTKKAITTAVKQRLVTNTKTNRTFIVIADANKNKPDVYHLYDATTLKRIDLGTVTSVSNSLKLQKCYKTETLRRFADAEHAIDGLLFECTYVERFDKWEPTTLIQQA